MLAPYKTGNYNVGVVLFRGWIMTGGLRIGWWRGLAAAAVGCTMMVLAPAPAQARVFIGFGVGPCCWAPAPYYYYPPPAYYYPPPPPPPAYPAPPPPAAYAAPPAGGAAPVAAPQISYTSRPPFRNAAGQTCREYRMASGGLGTACQDTSGQWRVAN